MKKKYHWGKTTEFKEIYKREKGKIDNLLRNSTFKKDLKEAVTAKSEDPEERQKEMADKQNKFCKKYNLRGFPISLSRKEFLPIIGPDLHFKFKRENMGTKSKIEDVYWHLDGTTSLEDKKRMLKLVQLYEELVHGKKEVLRPNRERDMEWYDMYYDKNSIRRKGITYKKIARDFIKRHRAEIKNRSLKDFDEELDREALKAAWNGNIINEIVLRVRVAIKREKDRGQKYRKNLS